VKMSSFLGRGRAGAEVWEGVELVEMRDERCDVKLRLPEEVMSLVRFLGRGMP